MRKNYYSYGSEAYNYDYESDYSYKIEKKSLSRVKKKEVIKSKAIPALVMLLSLVFIGSLTVLYSLSKVNAKSSEISSLQKKLESIKSDNIVLEEEMSKKFDLNTTQEIAEKKLGMHKPLAYQVVHIKKPKQNYVIKYNR